jgi:DNA-binding HxlR family transcriptional regulator
MPGKRSYRDPCGIARALDVIGQRWALLVVRELLLGPKRFSDLREALGGIATDVLAQRLKELEASGVLAQRTLPAPAASRVYELTPWGLELEPVLHALGRWGSRAPFPAAMHGLGVDAFVVALRTTFDPAGSRAARYQLVVDGQPFVAAIADGELTIERGEAIDADATIDGQVASLTAVVWHGAPLRDAIARGEISVSGDRRAIDRFPRQFSEPVPATA